MTKSRYDEFETETGEEYTKTIGEYTVVLGGYEDEFRDYLLVCDADETPRFNDHYVMSGDRDMIRRKWKELDSVEGVERLAGLE